MSRLVFLGFILGFSESSLDFTLGCCNFMGLERDFWISMVVLVFFFHGIEATNSCVLYPLDPSGTIVGCGKNVPASGYLNIHLKDAGKWSMSR